ncbi:hypothetical protein GCM10010350_72740 [Streptomyces galilaeus]|nr:hypothetical protein GCM10010350_72740 [Streptomyces galilaeus]
MDRPAGQRGGVADPLWDDVKCFFDVDSTRLTPFRWSGRAPPGAVADDQPVRSPPRNDAVAGVARFAVARLKGTRRDLMRPDFVRPGLTSPDLMHPTSRTRPHAP